MESCCLHYLSFSVCYFIIFLADLSTGFGSLIGICGILVLVPQSKSRVNGENPVDDLCRSPVLTKELKKKEKIVSIVFNFYMGSTYFIIGLLKASTFPIYVENQGSPKIP